MTKRTDLPISFFGKSITIACTDLVRTEHFYVDVLGAMPIPTDGYGCPWYRLGALTISLMPNAEQPSPAAFPEHAMPILWLEVDNIDAAYKHLQCAGTPIIRPPGDDAFMLIADPDGLVIEIWQRDDDEDSES
ncbi:MAG: VOC family protein [Anaerolineae bacterium]|nr:VOC family protein [Anaerolineae bacterium]